MECPVCDAPDAENITVKTGQFETFRCIRCGEYDVSDSVDLTRHDRRQRVVALVKANTEAKPGNRPMIQSYNLPS
jgi:Zn ribbon nucleic-acid-binding protein